MSKDKINILLASSKYMPEYAGSGLRAHNQYLRLTDKYREIDVSVLCGSETENSCSDYEIDSLKIKRIACKPHPKLSEGIIRKFQIAHNFHAEYSETVRYLNSLETKPDLIHVFGKNYVMAAALEFADRNGIPTIIELCNEMDTPFQFVPFPHKLWLKSAGSFSDKYYIVCISEHLKQMCLRNGIPEEKIWRRPNPVDEKRFCPVNDGEKTNLRRELTKFNENDKLLVYVANYRPSKNHGFLLDVMKLLPDEFKLYLGGPIVETGPKAEEHKKLYNDLEERIKNENLQERVQISSGFCKEIEKYYKIADVYPFPTLQEGLGTPMLESISCGVPVVANIIPGATDLWINDGQNGFLAETKAELFAEKIRLASAFPREQMLEEAKKIIKKTGTEVIDKEYYSLINNP